MLSRFFIDRPIFAWVIAIVVMLIGAIAILRLPVQQYPSVAQPEIQIQASYPGASAKTVEDTVVQIIEQRMKGLDGLLYISSTSDSTGTAQITLTFKGGTNIDTAQVQVQNKLQTATALLPQEVQQQGLAVVKSAKNFLMVVGLVSEDGRLSGADLGDLAASTLQDPLSRVDGVGDVQLFGSQYAMRIWMDPAKLAAVQLTPADIATAVRAQNAEVSAGQLAGAPATQGVALNATITAQSRLQTVDQFRNIVVKSNADGGAVRLGDVTRVEMGAENYAMQVRFNGKPAAGIAIKLAPGANALDTSKRLKTELDSLQKAFPQGVNYVIPYETGPFVQKSIEEVVKTLVEAVVLVFLVMFLFLQNWRATLIPTIAVPVVLLGTFGVLAAVGYTINILQPMFGLALAIGLLVDDAIVVVENVERVMDEEGLGPKEATRKSMGEITGALIGVALVLAAVFVPMAFFSGSQGVIYRQFSVTMISAITLSVLVALILTPALCATILKPVEKGHVRAEGGFFGWFNNKFDRGSAAYQKRVRGMFGQGKRWMAVYIGIFLVMGFLFLRLPSAFLPDEDQGIALGLVQLPPGATSDRTQKVLDQISHYFLTQEKDTVDTVFTVNGFSFAGSGQNMGFTFVKLKPFADRKSAQRKAVALSMRANMALSSIRDGMVFVIVPPAMPELGTSSGFDFELKDVGGLGHGALQAAGYQLLGMAGKDPALAGVRPNGPSDAPQLAIDIDQARAAAQGVSSADINAVLSAALGGSYINDFVDRGRVKRVFMQGDAPFRMRPEDLDRWYMRNGQGQMTPFSAIASSHWNIGSPQLQRYNGVASFDIQGAAAPGKSSGEAMKAMEDLAAKLPRGIGYEWTGLSQQEREAGAQAPILYGLSILVVFLLLAALYESWSIPLSIIMVIPLGVVGAVVATKLRGLDNDIYFQVGMLTTMGLASKNAILIVEFAKDLEKAGMSLVDATLEAVRIRLRPILMTSLAFVFGVMPLVISNGPGQSSQHAIGTGVVGGMLSATALAIFFVPLFYVLVRRTFDRKSRKAEAQTPPPASLATDPLPPEAI